MEDFLQRAVPILGEDNIEKLKNSRVAVFGVGGVGGALALALARSGVGSIDLIDKDIVEVSNINRQAVAFHSTIGKPKVEVMKELILDINPNIKVNCHNMFYLPETADSIPLKNYDYIADAIDNITAKIELILRAKEKNIKIISACGAGNKLDPTRFKVSDIYKTKVCPLAKIMRCELKKRGVKDLLTVYSEEEPVVKTKTPSSIAFVPPVMGYIMAGEIVKGLIK